MGFVRYALSPSDSRARGSPEAFVPKSFDYNENFVSFGSDIPQRNVCGEHRKMPAATNTAIENPTQSAAADQLPVRSSGRRQGILNDGVQSRRQHLRQWIRGAACLTGLGWLEATGLTSNLLAQDGLSTSGGGASEETGLLAYVEPKTSRYRCGLMLDAGRANCRGVVATFPLLREWPEQQITMVDQSIDPVFSRWTERELGDGLVKQFVTQVPAVRAGTMANALVTYEVTRSRIVGPGEADSAKTYGLEAPKKPSSELRQYLLESPYIDPGSARIRMAVREIEGLGGSTTWGRIEQVYDWVREKINYVEGDIKSADAALKDGTGDCEELTSAFIAICRAMRVPARMVYVLRHCYPEFYLEDSDGRGTWFPCQAAGTRQFGSMEEFRPILQKGDRFKVPDQGQKRYVAEYFKAASVSGGKPTPRFVQEELD